MIGVNALRNDSRMTKRNDISHAWKNDDRRRETATMNSWRVWDRALREASDDV